MLLLPEEEIGRILETFQQAMLVHKSGSNGYDCSFTIFFLISRQTRSLPQVDYDCNCQTHNVIKSGHGPQAV